MPPREVSVEAFVRLVDRLEEVAEGYVTLEEVERALGRGASAEIEQGVLLVDQRARPDGTPVILARLNRQHPQVRELTAW